MFNIYCISIIKDIKDIIGQSLTKAAEWADAIYVFDFGSTDGSWEIVNDLSKKLPNIVPFKSEPTEFHGNKLYYEVYHNYEHLCKENDWWCFLDADEFYIDDPRVFLSKVPKEFGAVWASLFQYYFTDIDKARYEKQPELYDDDVPINERIRYYINAYAEPRFFRFKKGKKYSPHRFYFHQHAFGLVYSEKIWLKHFQYRSPKQIQQRMNYSFNNDNYLHENQVDWLSSVFDGKNIATLKKVKRSFIPDWTERVVPSSKFNYDNLDNKLITRENDLPPLPVSIRYEFRKFRDLIKNRIIKKFNFFYNRLCRPS